MDYDVLHGQHEENGHGQQMKWLHLEKPRLFLWLFRHWLTCSRREGPLAHLKWARNGSHGAGHGGPVRGNSNGLGTGLLGEGVLGRWRACRYMRNPNVSGYQQSQDKQAEPHDSSMKWGKYDDPKFVSHSRQCSEKARMRVRIGGTHCQGEGQPPTSFQIIRIYADANHAPRRSSQTSPIYRAGIDNILRPDGALE
jgi:hypothetical protein